MTDLEQLHLWSVEQELAGMDARAMAALRLRLAAMRRRPLPAPGFGIPLSVAPPWPRYMPPSLMPPKPPTGERVGLVPWLPRFMR